MKASEFFELTKKVRAAQKQYFKGRLQGDLLASKKLEAELDKAISEGLEPDFNGVQISLFKDGDGNEE